MKQLNCYFEDLYDYNSYIRLINGMMKTMTGTMHPQQVAYDAFRDHIIRMIIFN